MIRIGSHHSNQSNNMNTNRSNSIIIATSPHKTEDAQRFYNSSKHSITSDWENTTPTYNSKPNHQKTGSHFFNQPIQVETKREKIKLGSTHGSFLYDSGHSPQKPKSSYQLIPNRQLPPNRYDPPLR